MASIFFLAKIEVNLSNNHLRSTDTVIVFKIPIKGLRASTKGSPSSAMVGQGATGLCSGAGRCLGARVGLPDNPAIGVLIVGFATGDSNQAIKGKTSCDHILGFQ